MNRIRTNTRLRSLPAALAAAFVVLDLAPALQAQQIAARPLTPQEIRNYGLPAGTQTSGGLLVTGVGEAVYLEAQVPIATEVLGVTWEVLQRPLGGSLATFSPTPIPPEMPIYSPGDREVYKVAGRTRFVPDLVGKYLIQAVVNATGGPIVLQAQVTGAEYAGVGTMGGASPRYPQCALCHREQALSYMETTHASYFERAIDGLVLPYYNANCIGCHTLGQNPAAANKGFADVARQVGWSFPATLQPGNWNALPMELKAKANVQCEHCHGAGSIHHGDRTTTAVSLSAGDCGQCHDSEPYYTQNREWELSRHAVATRYPTGETRAACVRCHSGIAFIELSKGATQLSTGYEAITCAVCHDPHSAENPHMVRTISDVRLENGHVVTTGGTGKLCMNCHKSRVNGPVYARQFATRFSPHYSTQTDMLAGTNAVEYGKAIPSTGHLESVKDGCATCHMARVGSGHPAHKLAGGHTFKMVFDNNTPDNPDDDIDIVAGCVECHGPIAGFDIPKADYNYDGLIEGVQTEVKRMMDALARRLPPLGSTTVTVTSAYTPRQLKAAFNYLFVYGDGSKGIHNTKYTVGLLREAMNDLADPNNALLNGQNVPVGGEWFYSPWFGFYAPEADSNWAYHVEHGYIMIGGGPGEVYFFEENTFRWRYTTPELYPLVYDMRSGAWLYYAGSTRKARWFYNYNTRQWVSFP